MKLRLVLMLTAGLGISGADAAEVKDTTKKELDVFQGEWKLVSAVRDGKDLWSIHLKSTRG
jgi:hypothetical protein